MWDICLSFSNLSILASPFIGRANVCLDSSYPTPIFFPGTANFKTAEACLSLSRG